MDKLFKAIKKSNGILKVNFSSNFSFYQLKTKDKNGLILLDEQIKFDFLSRRKKEVFDSLDINISQLVNSKNHLILNEKKNVLIFILIDYNFLFYFSFLNDVEKKGKVVISSKGS